MSKKIFSTIIALLILLSNPLAIWAQTDGNLPIYIVQPGENLTEIAEKFHISLDELITANNIIDVNIISAGTELIIPGLEGVSGILTAEPTSFGETFNSILNKFGLSVQTFTLLNPITSPSEIYAGSTLVLPQPVDPTIIKSETILGSLDSIFSIAIKTSNNPWVLAELNNSQHSTHISGDVIYFPSESGNEAESLSSDLITKIEVSPLPLVQGHTSVVRIYTKEPVIISGSMGEKALNFFLDQSSGFYYALTGISAIANPGLVPLLISGSSAGGESFSIEQNILLVSGGYRNEELSVEQTTIEQNIIDNENTQIQQIISPVTPDKLWTEEFRFPVDGTLSEDTIGFSSYFGSRRSYNNGSLTGFHGGLDFRVVLPTFNIYAPAPGRVVFTGSTAIRGNTTFIDHGQGVYSGYAHQSEINVAVGDAVQTGQIIGSIGSTGRVTGPHLHWDIWVNGIQVDPFDWVNNVYP